MPDASGGEDRAPNLVSCLCRAEACIDILGPHRSRYRRSLAALRERLVEEGLQIAVLGQFKRGKSTFLNALLGDSVLPTGVVPVTAIATFIGLTAEVAELVERNVENLRWATLQNLDSAFRRFAAWFDARFAETIGMTRGAIEAAARRRSENAAAAHDELVRLRQAAAELAAIRSELASGGETVADAGGIAIARTEHRPDGRRSGR